jgi:hypothetical protein
LTKPAGFLEAIRHHLERARGTAGLDEALKTTPSAIAA